MHCPTSQYGIELPRPREYPPIHISTLVLFTIFALLSFNKSFSRSISCVYSYSSNCSVALFQLINLSHFQPLFKFFLAIQCSLFAVPQFFKFFFSVHVAVYRLYLLSPFLFPTPYLAPSRFTSVSPFELVFAPLHLQSS